MGGGNGPINNTFLNILILIVSIVTSSFARKYRKRELVCQEYLISCVKPIKCPIVTKREA